MMNPQAIANTMVRHNTSRPLALKTISRRVPEMLRQIQRIQAVVNPGPADDRDDRDHQQNLPADEGQDAAVEGERQRLPVRTEIADEPRSNNQDSTACTEW